MIASARDQLKSKSIIYGTSFLLFLPVLQRIAHILIRPDKQRWTLSAEIDTAKSLSAGVAFESRFHYVRLIALVNSQNVTNL